MNKPIILVGEAWGEQEAKIQKGFCGPSGIELLRMLNESRILRLSPFDHEFIRRYYQNNDPRLIASIWDLHPEVYRTNVFNIHPPGNDLSWLCGPKNEALDGYPILLKANTKFFKHWTGGYVRGEFENELDRLAGEIVSIDPNLIICLGNSAIWALCGRAGITKLRGTSLLSTHCACDFKLLPTYHPAAVLRQWELRPTAVADLMKARRESTYPEIRRPHREIWIEPTIDDIRRFVDEHITGCRLLSVDIETAASRITCIGFAPSPGIALVVPFDDERSKNGNYWPTATVEAECWGIIRRVLADGSIPKLFQNGIYDIAFLWRSMKIKVNGAAEDTMLLSHALQPESLKGLGYLGSLFSDQGTWKYMRKKHETVKRDD